MSQVHILDRAQSFIARVKGACVETSRTELIALDSLIRQMQEQDIDAMVEALLLKKIYLLNLSGSVMVFDCHCELARCAEDKGEYHRACLIYANAIEEMIDLLERNEWQCPDALNERLRRAVARLDRDVEFAAVLLRDLTLELRAVVEQWGSVSAQLDISR